MVTIKPRYATYGLSGRALVSSTYQMAPGTNPKLTTSANESNSLPIGDLTFSARATRPSKKSKTPERITQYAARSSRLASAKVTPTQPLNRLKQVIRLGRCRFITDGGMHAGCYPHE